MSVVSCKYRVSVKRMLTACLVSMICLSASAQESAKLLSDGRKALEDGVYSFAQKQFEQYINQYGEKAEPAEYEDVLVLLLRSLREQKKYADMEVLLKGLNKKRISDSGMPVFWQTLLSYDKGDFAEAIKAIGKFAQKYPKSSYLGRMNRLLAWSHYKSGDIPKALQAFDALDKNFKDLSGEPENLLEWGQVLIAAGLNDKAAAVFNRLVRVEDDSLSVSEGRLWLGKIYILSSNYKKAMEVLDQLVVDESLTGDLRAEALYSVGFIHSAMTNSEAAVSSVVKGMNLAGSPRVKSMGALELGRVYLAAGDLGKGVTTLKAFVSGSPLNPESSGAQLQIADALLEAEEFAESVKEYQYYVETFTNTLGLARAHYGRGWSLVKLNRFAEGAVEFMKAHDSFGAGIQKERSLFKSADAHFQNKQFKSAVKNYEKLVSLYPESALVPEATFQIAESHFRAENYNDAEKVFRELIERYPKSKLSEEALISLAEMKVKQGVLREALTLYTSLISIHQESEALPEALFGRGNIYFEQWRFNKALTDFDKIVNDYPNSDLCHEAHYKRGMCYYWLGQDETALKVHEQFVSKYPQSPLVPGVHFWLGRYHFNHSQYKDAEKWFDGFVKAYSKHDLADDALLWKGHSLMRRHEYVDAIQTFAAVVKDYPDGNKIAEARFAQGEALCEIANYDASILILSEIINKYPESPLVISAWLRKGYSQFILGGDDPKRYEESIASYSVVINSSNARPEEVLEAEYRIARCLEKMGRIAESYEYYYQKILLRVGEEKEKGVWHSESSRLWLAKAALAAAKIAEEREDYKAAVSILEQLVQFGGEAAPDARKRIDILKSEHWWLFY